MKTNKDKTIKVGCEVVCIALKQLKVDSHSFMEDDHIELGDVLVVDDIDYDYSQSGEKALAFKHKKYKHSIKNFILKQKP